MRSISKRKAGSSGLFLCVALIVTPLASTAPAFAGEMIAIEVVNAELAYDQRTGRPLVSFKMNESSKRLFAGLTSRNVGRKMELRVDGKVVMAPVIREPITGGTGQISDNSLTAERARDLADRLLTGRSTIEVEIAND